MDTQQLMELVNNLELARAFTDVKKTNEWIPVVAAIGGAFVGALGAVIPNLLIERYKRSRDRDAVTSALICEISSILEIIEIRQFVSSLKEIEAGLQGSQTYIFKIKVSEDHSMIFRSLTDKIGTVEKTIAAKIIRFHQLINSVIQDVIPGGVLADQGGNKSDFTEVLGILESAISVGQDLVNGHAL
jgi:hypothetical protein